MTRRPLDVLVLGLLTLGIYTVVWLVMTRRELVRDGADIPSAWWLLVPLLNLYWLWRWAGGVAYRTKGRLSQPGAFLLLWLVGVVGAVLVQTELNVAHARARLPELPVARIV